MNQPLLSPPPADAKQRLPLKPVLLYMAAQVGLGAALACLHWEDWPGLRDALALLDARFAAFRTGFVHSPTPVACKLFLALWWLLVVPWGLAWCHGWSQGFRPRAWGLGMSGGRLLGCWLAFLGCALVTAYLFSGFDYGAASYFAGLAPLADGGRLEKPPRAPGEDWLGLFMSHGVLLFSVLMAYFSAFFVACLAGVICLARTMAQKWRG